MTDQHVIGLVGFFGWGNFGDELFVEAHRRFLGHLGELRPVNDLTRKPYFSEPVEMALSGYDAFVIGGGDLVVPWTASDLYWKPEFLERPVFLTGVGVPQWQDPRPRAMQIYRNFMQSDQLRMIIARDNPSCVWIKNRIQPNVEPVWHPDLVCALDFPAVEKPAAGRKILGVALRKRPDRKDDFSAVRAMCERAKRMGYDIRLIVLGTGQVGEADFEVAKDFAASGEEIVYSEDLWELCAAIGQCTQLATMKFHGTVVASMYGVPSIAMAPTDKNRHFLRMLDRFDQKCAFGNDKLPEMIVENPEPIPEETIAKLRDGARAGYSKLARGLEAALASS